MPLKALKVREASEVGTTLADAFVSQIAAVSSRSQPNNMTAAGAQGGGLQRELPRFLQQVDREARPLGLNLFQRAKLANSFKWRLLEKGCEREFADELTRELLLRLSGGRSRDKSAPAAAHGSVSGNVETLLAKGNEQLAVGAVAEAVNCYQRLLSLDPRHAIGRNNLGGALCKLGRYREAEDQFRRAIGVKAGYPEAHCNLGTVLRWMGRNAESEAPLRRALKLKPTYPDAQTSLGTTLLVLGRVLEARALFEKVLRVAPRNVEALVGLGQLLGPEGRLDEAEKVFRQALEIDPHSSAAWAGLVRLREMSPRDAAWLKGAEAASASGLAPLDEANIRYAIGKYCDDIGDYGRAFRSYRRANELQKMAAEPYDRDARTRFVDDLIRVCTHEVVSRGREAAADSARPVFVTGMVRSGTTLVAQIIHSHPAAEAVGELAFWSDAVRSHETAIRREPLEDPLARKLAAAYLRTLARRSANAQRVVDKATFNADYLGIIHAVFPNARLIYLRRDPIDSCLSCYFQPFSPALNFTMDLSDLAHYYREHHRLVEHWRRVLPPGALLEVPYAELTADQERWTRRIIEFIGLEWDERCLDFHTVERTVLTASYWQVRQKIYNRAVGRWRNYRKFITPLLALADLDSQPY